jgi:hypothetical protein
MYRRYIANVSQMIWRRYNQSQELIQLIQFEDRDKFENGGRNFKLLKTGSIGTRFDKFEKLSNLPGDCIYHLIIDVKFLYFC